MNWLNISSWSINLKVFIIGLIAIVILNLVSAPITIESVNAVQRQAFRQVVTESALRQKAAIDEDFANALNIFEQFQDSTFSYLSIVQWLTRSDPTTEGFGVNATQTKAAADRAIQTEILDLAPASYRQAWLIDAEGQVITNVTNFIDPRFAVDVGDYVSVVDSPAHRAGQLLADTGTLDRNIDLVVEQIGDELSLQLIAALYGDDVFVGTLVVELNNISIILGNLQLSGVNNDTYSFVASPGNADVAIALGTTPRSLINLNTQATRSSANLQEAQFYVSGNRRVIGYYMPLFEEFRNDVVFVVELDEATALSDVSLSILSTSGPTLLLQIVMFALAVAILNYLLVRPIMIVTDTIRAINAGDFHSPFPINTSDDEIGRLAETVIELRQQLQNLTSSMSARIDARSRDLQVTQEIGRVAITETNLDSLMTQVVTLIAERFEQIYHAQIFLIEGNYAVLKASTGAAGEQLLARGHRLAVGSLSVIGQVTQQNQTIIARDTAASEVHRRNEFLRDTHAELAIPMRLGNRVIGVLDVQSTIRDAFDDDLVTILETMTDQISIAIENSRLFEQSQQRLEEFENATRQRIQRNWEDFMYSQRTSQIVSHAGAQVVYDFENLRQQAARTRLVAVGDITGRDTIPIAIPVIIRDQVLGVIELEVSEADYNHNRVLLAEELASRLAVSLDNARLVQAGRQTAENERIINTISAKISGQTDIEQILQTAIQEVGQALRAPRVNIKLHQSNTNGNGHHHDQDHTPNSDNS